MNPKKKIKKRNLDIPENEIDMFFNYKRSLIKYYFQLIGSKPDVDIVSKIFKNLVLDFDELKIC